MAWVTPRTWSPGETVTASLMNAHVRDNMNALSGRGLFIPIGTIGGGVITTGIKHYIPVPASLNITGWRIVADQAGSIVVDIWKDSFANHPPTAADSIAGTEKPTLSAAISASDLALTTWSPQLTAGDVLVVNVDSAATVNYVGLTLIAEPV